jgi:hypothetical protein
LNAAAGDPQALRRLLRIQTLDLAKHEDEAKALGHLLDRAVEDGLSIRPSSPRLRVSFLPPGRTGNAASCQWSARAASISRASRLENRRPLRRRRLASWMAMRVSQVENFARPSN